MLKVGKVEKEGKPKRFAGIRSEGWIDREKMYPGIGRQKNRKFRNPLIP